MLCSLHQWQTSYFNKQAFSIHVMNMTEKELEQDSSTKIKSPEINKLKKSNTMIIKSKADITH